MPSIIGFNEVYRVMSSKIKVKPDQVRQRQRKAGQGKTVLGLTHSQSAVQCYVHSTVFTFLKGLRTDAATRYPLNPPLHPILCHHIGVLVLRTRIQCIDSCVTMFEPFFSFIFVSATGMCLRWIYSFHCTFEKYSLKSSYTLNTQIEWHLWKIRKLIDVVRQNYFVNFL